MINESRNPFVETEREYIESVCNGIICSITDLTRRVLELEKTFAYLKNRNDYLKYTTEINNPFMGTEREYVVSVGSGIMRSITDLSTRLMELEKTYAYLKNRNDYLQYTTGTNNEASNILLLGMSYYNLESVANRVDMNHIVGLLNDGSINQHDGRDIARILDIETKGLFRVYTISIQESGNYSRDRHRCVDFNSRYFITELDNMLATGNINTRKISQVYLDYFYTPPGWTDDHWQAGLFDNLIGMVDRDMFYMGSSDNWFTRDGGTYVTSDVGVVYLPLNKTCLNLIHSKLSSFRTRFLITFLRCDELDEHILWNSLNGNGNLTNMVKNLCGKDPKKELRYCDFENLDRYLKSGFTLSNPSQLRIIKLSVLRNKTPGYNNMTCPYKGLALGVTEGGYVGFDLPFVPQQHEINGMIDYLE